MFRDDVGSSGKGGASFGVLRVWELVWVGGGGESNYASLVASNKASKCYPTPMRTWNSLSLFSPPTALPVFFRAAYGKPVLDHSPQTSGVSKGVF